MLEFLNNNWLWILLIGSMVLMHLGHGGGHGGHGGHGGCGGGHQHSGHQHPAEHEATGTADREAEHHEHHSQSEVR